jgi:hypothetical protein
MDNFSFSTIEPYQEVETKTISGFRVNINTIILNKSADLLVDSFDASGNFLNTKLLKMSGTDYENWKNDDNYVYSYAAKQLGYNIIDKPFPSVD